MRTEFDENCEYSPSTSKWQRIIKKKSINWANESSTFLYMFLPKWLFVATYTSYCFIRKVPFHVMTIDVESGMTHEWKLYTFGYTYLVPDAERMAKWSVGLPGHNENAILANKGKAAYVCASVAYCHSIFSVRKERRWRQANEPTKWNTLYSNNNQQSALFLANTHLNFLQQKKKQQQRRKSPHDTVLCRKPLHTGVQWRLCLCLWHVIFLVATMRQRIYI